MDTLAKRKRKQVASVAVLVALLVGLAAYNAWRPAATDADQVRSLGTMIIDTDWDQTSPEQRDHFRQQWESLSPQARQEVFNMVARHRIQEMRRRFHELSPDARTALIQETLEKMRQQRRDIPREERETIRERLHSEEGKAMVKTAMELYLTEFTAKERAQMDPLMHEWLLQIQELAR